MSAAALPTETAPPDPALYAPLAHLKGARPEAPQWFDEALAQAPERQFVEVDGAEIEMLAWGRRGDPGMLLLHGFGAHAEWWSFLAPLLAADGRRVAAISFSGMGLSGWRDAYSLPQHASEALAAAEAAGLFESDQKPVIVGHSYGSFVTLQTMGSAGDRFKAAVAVDSPMSGGSRDRPPRLTKDRGPRQRVYPTLESGLARFRFAPLQPCDNLFIVDHIARHSLRPAPEGEGWVWRFDPQVRDKMVEADRRALVGAVQRPLAIMIGGRSKLMTPERLAFMRAAAPAAPWVEIPEAGHHLMADQPLAFLSGLRGLLAGWPRPAA
jgi:pimeloyl-ACP methyl ester carboxylesterase